MQRVVLLILFLQSFARGFLLGQQRYRHHGLSSISPQHQELLDGIEKATELREAEESSGQHDKFRYEWGTWCDDDNLDALRELLGRVRAVDCKDNVQKYTGQRFPRCLQVASGDRWECNYIVIPQEQTYEMPRRVEGSWTFCQPLTGVLEIETLKGPNRDGEYTVQMTKTLRGANIEFGFGKKQARTTAVGGETAAKYIGGPIRRYCGKAGVGTIVLEAVVYPPGGQKREKVEVFDTSDLGQLIQVVEEVVNVEEEMCSEGQIQMNSTGHLGLAMGMSFDNVGGLDKQLDAIARRVMASRANPEAARRLGVNHVRGILLSGPPGCGKTLLARELALLLNARKPQIVNGPEILDKFIGEAEKKVRELFLPAELEYREVGDDSALHIIIFDEMDAIARKRGSMSSDTTGVRDSVVNQLLAKMDGIQEANNVLVIGLTNRPELLDPALLRPGRLEVQLRVELPDLVGRRDILRIHTRRMREEGALSEEATTFVEDLQYGLPVLTEYFTGAELAGLVRSAASFALARTVDTTGDSSGVVQVSDLKGALSEITPALGKQDETLKARFPSGICRFSPQMESTATVLEQFLKSEHVDDSVVRSMLLVGSSKAWGLGGTGVTALAAWAAATASANGEADYVRFISVLDLLSESSGSEEDRAKALMDRFSEAQEFRRSVLVLDDIDQICAGNGPNGLSPIMLATIRALLRTTPAQIGQTKHRSVRVIGTTACAPVESLSGLFDESEVSSSEVNQLIQKCSFADIIQDPQRVADVMIERLVSVGCKTALQIARRAAVLAESVDEPTSPNAQVVALTNILDSVQTEGVSSKEPVLSNNGSLL